MKRRKRIVNTICYIVLILISVIWLFPFLGLVLQSFRGESGGMVSYLVPQEWSLKNYQFLFGGNSKFLKWYSNTLIIALFVSVLQTIVIICVSYALSRMRFNGRKALMNIWLVLGMFPGFLTMTSVRATSIRFREHWTRPPSSTARPARRFFGR